MHIEEPTLSVTFSVNDSPLAGTEGKFVTSNKIDERLKAEMNTNIAMSYEQIGEGKFKVNGRGELHQGPELLPPLQAPAYLQKNAAVICLSFPKHSLLPCI